ncbi:uncharacterized protein A4U43_C08F13370 [Asparagus officinalis]|uniref:cyclin-A3-1-like isoform X2 n=1 Tax=Asparagus officinalis TaxID=4686 RepID=UPI00098E106D|nr:cyclin-A3-1-like isoform X2 [Asparagus officinalis]ONK60020.1 uncharacterized protein A4U43_C08F13370 [Asparagus officinalis]
MADKENCVRLTRAQAKKRSAASLQAQPMASNPKRKRTALAEIPISTNAPAKPVTRMSKKKEEAKKAVTLPPAADEAVHSDLDDPQMCPHYATDIHQYLRSMEVEAKRRPMVNFIEKVQTDVTANMRGILVDWLIEVAEEYKLASDTLYLTISYIDRYLSSNVLNRQKLQLLGVSAMLIASKYEEITPPHVEDFCYITDNTYTKQEVVKMESDILKFLNFEMGNPTIKTFLRRFIKAGLDDSKYNDLNLEFLANYIAELSLVDYGCVQFLPSTVAASAVFLARLTLLPDSHPWSSKLQQQTNYKLSDLKDCIKALHDLQLNKKKSSLTAVREKYKQHKFKFVTTLVPPLEIPTSYFEGF